MKIYRNFKMILKYFLTKSILTYVLFNTFIINEFNLHNP